MTWINVKDRLPVEGKWVLLGSSTHEFVDTGIYFEGKFVNPDLDYLHRPTVTHWMPLPKAPEEKE